MGHWEVVLRPQSEDEALRAARVSWKTYNLSLWHVKLAGFGE